MLIVSGRNQIISTRLCRIEQRPPQQIGIICGQAKA
jgi:hypothetical protein